MAGPPYWGRDEEKRPKQKRNPAKRKPREDVNQIAYRGMQEVIC